MKKIWTFMSVFLACLLLTGCISIPLGDGGKLELSKDGINVDLGEEEELGVGEVENMEDMEEEEIVVKEDVAGEEAATENDETDDKGAAKDEGDSGVTTSSTSCDELIEDPKGNDRLVKALAKLAPPDFPLTDCTLMGGTKESYSKTYEAIVIETNFKVEGYWADSYDVYVEYMDEAGFGPLSKSENAKDKSARVSGKTADYDLSLHFQQRNAEDETELVQITFVLYHYDVPQDEE